MIYNKFLICPDLPTFQSNLDSGNIVDQHVVFISGTKQIWTHGTYYSSSSFDQDTIDKLTSIASLIKLDEDGTKYLTDDGTYKSIDVQGYYNIPYPLLSLTNDSIHSEILNALGTPEEFDNIRSAINSGTQLAISNDTDHTYISLWSETGADPLDYFTFIVCIMAEDKITLKVYTIYRDGSGNFSCIVDESTGEVAGETCRVILQSNQGSSDASSLLGVKVTINGQEYTYDGNPIEAVIPFTTEYEVSFGDLTNYNTPASQSFTAMDVVREVIATYTCSIITVHIQTNQTNPNSDLNGLTINAAYGSGSTNLTYQSADLTFKVPIGSSVTITSGDASQYGYTTPESTGLTATENNHTVNLSYNAQAITINLTANNGVNYLNGATVSVGYGEVNKVLTWAGSALIAKVPLNMDYTLTSSSPIRVDTIPYFRAPDVVSGTASSANDSVELEFKAELVNVSVSGLVDDDTATLILKVGDATLNTFEVSASSTSFSDIVAWDQVYTIECGESSNGFNATGGEYTARQDSRDVSVAYLDNSFTIVIDRTSSDPGAVSIEGNESAVNTLLGLFRRCLCSKKADGEVDITFLRDDNSNYYEDSVEANLTGPDGDVMVYFPEMWYYGETTETQHRFRISLEEKTGFHHAPASLVGAYKGYVSDAEGSNRLYSVSDVESSIGVSIEEFNLYSSDRGTGYHLIDYQQHCIIAWMLMARYKTRNGQAVCGTGPNVYTGINNGSTNDLGITDTTSETASSSGSTLVNFLGLEGIWGYRNEFMEGIHSNYEDGVICYDKGFYQWLDYGYSNITSSTKRIVLPSGENECHGWIMDIVGGEYMDTVGANGADNGSVNTYYCDYSYIDTNSVGWCSRSSYISLEYGGPYELEIMGGNADTYYTTRLSFDGIINQLPNSEYRSLYQGKGPSLASVTLTLNFNTTVSLTINGYSQGSVSTWTGEFNPGTSVTISAIASGYQNYSNTITVNSNQTLQINMTRVYTYTVRSNCNGATVNFNGSPMGTISGGSFIYTSTTSTSYTVTLTNVSLPSSSTYTSERAGSGSDYSWSAYTPNTYSVEMQFNPNNGNIRMIVTFNSAPEYWDINYSQPYTCTYVDTHTVTYSAPGSGSVSANGSVTLNYGSSDSVTSTSTTNKQYTSERVETSRNQRSVAGIFGGAGGWFNSNNVEYNYSSSYYHQITSLTTAIYEDTTLTGEYYRERVASDATNYSVQISRGDMQRATPTKSWETITETTTI